MSEKISKKEIKELAKEMAKEATEHDNKEVRFKFGGKTEGFIDKAEEKFEQAHLRAYLKGKDRFKHGTYPETLTNDDGQVMHKGDPIWYFVKRLKVGV